MLCEPFDGLGEFGDGDPSTSHFLDGVPRRFFDLPICSLIPALPSTLRRQRFHFAGDDGEALAASAGSRRFDRFVQRQRFVSAAIREIRPTTEPTFPLRRKGSDRLVGLNCARSAFSNLRSRPGPARSMLPSDELNFSTTAAMVETFMAVLRLLRSRRLILPRHCP